MTKSKSVKKLPVQEILKEGLEGLHYRYTPKDCLSAYLDNAASTMRSMQAMWSCFSAMQKELQQNSCSMLGTEMKAVQKASTCHSLSELVSVRNKIAQKWVDNYMSEVQKLYLLYTKNTFKLANLPDAVKSHLLVE